MFVGILFIYIISFVHFRLLLGSSDNFLKDLESEFEELKSEINLWTLTYQSITPVTKGEKIVKTLLKEKVSQLESLLSNNLIKTKSEYKTTMKTKSQDMVENYRITNMSLLFKCACVFLITLVLFFLNPFVAEIQLTIGWISILAALVLLAASSNNVDLETNGTPNSANDDTIEDASLKLKDQHLQGIGFEAIMHKIEWSTNLIFIFFQ
jgi:hypothetical protein